MHQHHEGEINEQAPKIDQPKPQTVVGLYAGSHFHCLDAYDEINAALDREDDWIELSVLGNEWREQAQESGSGLLAMISAAVPKQGYTRLRLRTLTIGWIMEQLHES